jgi:hypothetical protein
MRTGSLRDPLQLTRATASVASNGVSPGDDTNNSNQLVDDVFEELLATAGVLHGIGLAKGVFFE